MSNFHAQLNPKLWKDDKLLPEVREKLIDIVNVFIDNCTIKPEVVDVHLVGSNASFNYTDYSDLDLHIVVNFDIMNSANEVLMALFSLEKTRFNKTYKPSVHGVNVEVYVEDVNASTISNGIYSLLNNEWIKFPKPLTDVPEVVFGTELAKWEDLLNKILVTGSKETVKNIINQLYVIRKNSIMLDGEYGKGNQLFKQLRNKGLLDKLKSRLEELQAEDLKLENINVGEYIVNNELWKD